VAAVEAPPAQVAGAMEPGRLFDRWQIIGEGVDFLVVRIDCPGSCPAVQNLSALALDADGLPVRRITGFPRQPQPARDGAVWFFFVLFDPYGSPAYLRQSRHLRFTLLDKGRKIERTVDHAKTWRSEDRRVIDGPLPPEVVSGRLVLCDYVFLADGDPRHPKGTYVSVRLHRSAERRHPIEVVSDLKGADEPPEIRIETDRGWLELATGRRHSMQEAVAPLPPYVEGWWDGKGCFHPEPRILR
jgi:hypothetical protein